MKKKCTTAQLLSNSKNKERILESIKQANEGKLIKVEIDEKGNFVKKEG